MFRIVLKLFTALAIVSLTSVVFAQQQQQPAAAPAPAAATAASQPAPSAVEPAATSQDNAARPLKAATAALRELSPWSMFLSADILVKAVMIGLAIGRAH